MKNLNDHLQQLPKALLEKMMFLECCYQEIGETPEGHTDDRLPPNHTTKADGPDVPF